VGHNEPEQEELLQGIKAELEMVRRAIAALLQPAAMRSAADGVNSRKTETASIKQLDTSLVEPLRSPEDPWHMM
jgi:hypothetical protein